MHGCRHVAAEGLGRVALPVKALKAGQEAYWLDQIARNREEYFSGRGESPGRFVGSAAATAGLEGVASAEQVRAMFQGVVPATGEVRCAPLHRADPRSKLAAGPLLAALKTRAAEQGVEELEALAGSKALKGDVRSVQAACRLGGARRVKVETVERLCRKVLKVNPGELYGEAFSSAWQHRGKRVNERVQAFDHCFGSPRACRCWPPAPALRSGGCWPRVGTRPSLSPSATWNATASASAGSTTAPTATRRSGGWWRWPSSTA
jgi:TrwC relaxase